MVETADGGVAKTRKTRSLKIFLRLSCLSLALLLLGLSLYGGVYYSRFSHLATQYVHHHYDRQSGGVRYTLSASRPQYWVSLDELDKRVYGAIMVSEDWGFYQHSGLDIPQIRRAIADFFRGKKLRGASTITQQLVKNLYLHNQRSWGRKIKEAFLALVMERALSKQKILETYLNIIEYGEGVYGIGRAAQYYFRQSALDLSAQQGAFLAVLLPNPRQYSQAFLQGELTPFIIEGVYEVLEKMRVAGHLSLQEFEYEIEILSHTIGD